MVGVSIYLFFPLFFMNHFDWSIIMPPKKKKPPKRKLKIKTLKAPPKRVVCVKMECAPLLAHLCK